MTHVVPAAGVRTQGWGCTAFYAEPAYGTCAHFHPAWDIANAYGTPVRASAAGKVVAAGWNGIIAAGYTHAGEQAGFGGGNVIVIQHNTAFWTLYAHLQVIRVGVGQSVAQAQWIGDMGATGNATGPHVHWGAWYRDLWFTTGTSINNQRILAGGDLANNPAYNPPSASVLVQITPGVNIRTGPGTNFPVYRTTSATYISPLRLPFGGWVNGGSYGSGSVWAKIGLNGIWVYVAKPFVRFV